MLHGDLHMLVGLLLHSPPLLHAPQPSAASIVMGWDDPNWNWGSAIGTAHDEAMKVRAALATPEARKDFLFSVFAGQADQEEAKMALALKCQRARNLGYDTSDWEGLMDAMAACKFEGEGGSERLCDAIRRRLESPPNETPGLDPLNTLVASAFTALEFVEKGC